MEAFFMTSYSSNNRFISNEAMIYQDLFQFGTDTFHQNFPKQ